MSIPRSQDVVSRRLDVDDPHTELLARSRALAEAVAAGGGPEQTLRLLDALEDHVIAHFAAEEQYMIRLDDPGFVAHRGSHQELILLLMGCRRRMRAGGLSATAATDLHRQIEAWSHTHIPTFDAEFSRFVQARGAA